MTKIAIIGPESTGKTTLSKQLAHLFSGEWENELARDVVESLNREYTYDDVCTIARQQIAIEEKYDKLDSNNGLVFFDTELIVTKVWFAFKYGIIPDFLQKRMESQFFDFYLLLYPDIEWVADGVRENGDQREFLFEWYRKEVEQMNIPYAIVRGIGEKRFENAKKAIDNFMERTPSFKRKTTGEI